MRNCLLYFMNDSYMIVFVAVIIIIVVFVFVVDLIMCFFLSPGTTLLA